MTRLTTEQLEEIRKRAEKATEGPWELDEADNGVWNKDGRNYLGSVSTFYDYDAEFIAEARTDIPKLLAEVERLQTELSELNDEIRVQVERDDIE